MICMGKSLIESLRKSLEELNLHGLNGWVQGIRFMELGYNFILFLCSFQLFSTLSPALSSVFSLFLSPIPRLLLLLPALAPAFNPALFHAKNAGERGARGTS